MLIIPLNLDSVLLLLHNSKLAYLRDSVVIPRLFVPLIASEPAWVLYFVTLTLVVGMRNGLFVAF